jgi:hypothetical protein
MFLKILEKELEHLILQNYSRELHLNQPTTSQINQYG